MVRMEEEGEEFSSTGLPPENAEAMAMEVVVAMEGRRLAKVISVVVGRAWMELWSSISRS